MRAHWKAARPHGHLFGTLDAAGPSERHLLRPSIHRLNPVRGLSRPEHGLEQLPRARRPRPPPPFLASRLGLSRRRRHGASADGLASDGVRPVARRISADDPAPRRACASISSSRARLEVQPQQRLGVRRADVQVPVVASTESPSRCETGPPAPKRSFSSWSFSGDVGDRRVDLAGEEVARAQRREDLAQLLPALRDAARA